MNRNHQRELSDTEAYINFVCKCVADVMGSLPPQVFAPFYMDWLRRADERLEQGSR